MQNIDLSLAINYIPACTCLFRMALYSIVDMFVFDWHDARLRATLGFVLYLDRVVQGKGMFFDGNSIIFTAFFAHEFQYIRKYSNNLDFTVLMVYFVWGLLAAFITADAHPVTQNIANMVKLNSTLIQTICTISILSFLLYHTAINEHYLCDVVKANLFGIVSVIWIYIIGLKRGTITTHSILVRFLPVLILPIWMSLVYFLLTFLLVVWCVKNHVRVMLPPCDTEDDPEPVAISIPPPVSSSVPEPEDDEDELVAIFRQAKAEAVSTI